MTLARPRDVGALQQVYYIVKCSLFYHSLVSLQCTVYCHYLVSLFRVGRGDFEKFREKFRPFGIWQR